MSISMLPCHALLFFILLASSHFSSIQSQPYSCNEGFSFMRMSMVKNITHCKKLPTLGFELGWNYYNTTTNVTLDVVFSAKPPTRQGWVAWGVNPRKRPKMVGTRALIAFILQNGSPVVYTYNVTGDTKRGCKLNPSKLDLEVDNSRVNYSGETGMITVAATLSLPPLLYNISRLNHVWQVGPRMVSEVVPAVHVKRLHNFDSRETINLTSGHSFGHLHASRRVAHGVLGVIGWGFLLPVGVIVARYFKAHPFPARRWFLVHVGLQITAFIIGTTAWGLGLSLVRSSEHFRSFIVHRILGIWVFCLAALQITALWLKPHKMDRYRKYWSIYHHFIGYSLIALTIINIFKGLDILRPPSRWRWAYIGILISLSCITFGLEIMTWVKFCWKPKKEDKTIVPLKA